MKIVAGVHRHRKLLVPKGKKIRPTTAQLRETLFNICQNVIEGATFLDLFAGIGAIGLEALSRGAASATFVEKDKEALKLIRENIHLLGEENRSFVLSLDVFKAIKRLHEKGEKFDLIFADPPYHESTAERLLECMDLYPLLNKEGIFFLEERNKDCDPEISLNTLRFKGSRRVGNTLLRQYTKIL